MGLLDIFKKDRAQPVSTGKSTNRFEVALGINKSINISTTNPAQDDIDAVVIPVEERVKTATASNHGLFPHEILVLEYAPSFYTEGNSFQGFWWYSYGVRDVQGVLTSLAERGFLEIAIFAGL